MNESKELVVTMTCDLQFGSDSVKNADAIKKAIAQGFEILGADGQRMTLQYVNGHIFDGRIEAGLDHSPDSSIALPGLNPAKISEEPATVTFCSLCAKNKIRRDNGGCPQCKRKVCRDCRRPSGSARSGYCLECAPMIEDGRAHNGGARPGSGPIKRTPAPTWKKSIGVTPVNAAGKAVTLGSWANMCGVCKKHAHQKKCLVCSAYVCSGCWNDANESCSKCAAVE